MLVNPAPGRARARRTPAPSSLTTNVRLPASSRTSTSDPCALARVLARVLQRLEHAEVDRGLGLGRRSARGPRRRPSTGNTARRAADSSAAGRPLSASNGG